MIGDGEYYEALTVSCIDNLYLASQSKDPTKVIIRNQGSSESGYAHAYIRCSGLYLDSLTFQYEQTGTVHILHAINFCPSFVMNKVHAYGINKTLTAFNAGVSSGNVSNCLAQNFDGAVVAWGGGIVHCGNNTGANNTHSLVTYSAIIIRSGTRFSGIEAGIDGGKIYY